MATRTTLLMLTALAFSAPVAAQPFVDATETWGPVSYTHLTLPTICSV